MTSFSDLQRAVGFRAGETLHFVVRRDGAELPLDATPVLKDVTDGFGNKSRIGVLGISRDPTASDVTTEHFTVPQAAWLGAQETWFIVDRTLSYMVGVVRGRESPDQLGGPIRVAEVSAQVATIGFVALVNLAAILSVSIGLINLFPIPMARRRAPALLPVRGDPGKTAQRARPGHRLPHRAGSRSGTDDFRDLERHNSFEFTVNNGFHAWRTGHDRLDSRQCSESAACGDAKKPVNLRFGGPGGRIRRVSFALRTNETIGIRSL